MANYNALKIIGGPCKVYHTAVSDLNYLGSTNGPVKPEISEEFTKKIL